MQQWNKCEKPETSGQIHYMRSYCLVCLQTNGNANFPFDENIWGEKDFHEPLTLTITFPFLSHQPWQLRRSKVFLELDRLLPRLWKESPTSAGSLLYKLCTQTLNLGSLPKGYCLQETSDFYVQKPTDDLGSVWIKEKDRNRFLEARNGDFLHFPFQCDCCWFRNLKGRCPVVGSFSDDKLLMFIRRANLDGMWSQEPSTVASIRLGVANIVENSTKLGFTPVLSPLRPWPVSDTVGFNIALVQLSYAQNRCKNESTHLQFDSVRKLITTASHIHESSATANISTAHTFRNIQGDSFTNSSCPTQTRCFQTLMEGLLERMGKQTKSNMGLDYRILHLILNGYEAELAE